MIDATSLLRALVLTTALAACASPTASGRVADARVRGGVVSAPSAARHAPDQGVRPRVDGIGVQPGSRTGALAQPAPDVGTSTSEHAMAVARDHRPRATPRAITFTNPLGRSRGPGAGAGLL
jgi:hypothetical protein